MNEQLPHVCFVAPNAFPLLMGEEDIQIIGGAEVQQVMVAKGLAERGFPVSMICLDFGQKEQVRIGKIRVFRAFRAEAGIPVLKFFSPRLTSIWRNLVLADADIYYQRAASMLTGVVAAFCQRHGKKSVFASAGNPDLERKTSRINLARDRWIYEYGLRHVDKIVVQNPEQVRLARQNFGRDAALVPNCYPPRDWRPNSGGGRVLWVSTIRKVKQPQLFLGLAKALPTYRFQMIGGPGAGDKSLYDSIMSQANEIPNLEFMGFVPYSKAEEFFDSASIFVNTSASEGFPNTFLQAWARGVPTISFVDCGARKEGLPVGIQVSSFEEMVARTRQLLENPGERAEIGMRCREYFKSNHVPERVLELYEAIFKELALG